MMVALGPKTNVVLVTTMAPFELRVSQPDESRRFCRARLCRAFYALFNVCVFEFCIFFPLSWLIFMCGNNWEPPRIVLGAAGAPKGILGGILCTRKCLFKKFKNHEKQLWMSPLTDVDEIGRTLCTTTPSVWICQNACFVMFYLCLLGYPVEPFSTQRLGVGSPFSCPWMMVLQLWA